MRPLKYGGDVPAEAVMAEVQELKKGQYYADIRDGTTEVVLAQVEMGERGQGRDRTAEGVVTEVEIEETD